VTPSKAFRAAIYARVSTTDQNCALQLTELRQYVERNGWSATEYVDQGVSGAKRSRPALDRLMADARLRRFDVVVVWKLDRFGRSMINLIDHLRDLDALGIRFVAPTQGIDTDQRSPTGRLILHILAALAEFERELIRERTRAGVAEAKRRGKHCGRPQSVFRRDLAVDMRKKGMSLRAIAGKLGVSLMTISRVLSQKSGQKPPAK
jgi:DNA invertase Pin-like site-specific DNA recombinase